MKMALLIVRRLGDMTLPFYSGANVAQIFSIIEYCAFVNEKFLITIIGFSIRTFIEVDSRELTAPIN